jgi:hypothetical protein
LALARCEKCGPPVQLKFSYPHRHVAKPDHQFLCGTHDCTRPVRYVWLTDAEQGEYVNGKRLFGVRSKHGTIELM